MLIGYMLFAVLTHVLKNGLILLFFEALLAIYAIYKRNETTLVIFIFLTILQNFTLILLSSDISGLDTRIFIIIKELIVYICGLLGLVECLYKRKLGFNETFLCLLFIADAILSFFVSSAPISARIASIRQFSIPFFAFYFGISLKKSNNLNLINSNLLLGGIIVCVSGLLIYLSGDDFWNKIGYQTFIANKTGIQQYADMINFYTFDFGNRIKRFVSIFGDPLACAHFLMISCLVLFYTYPHKLTFIKILMVICMCLCLSKAHIIFIISIILVKLFERTKNLETKYIYIFVIVALIFVAFVVLYFYSKDLKANTSIGNHFNSFLSGLKNISLIGNGIGTSGYNAVLTGYVDNVSGTSESLMATIIYQMGLVGVIIFYGFIITASRSCLKQLHKLHNQNFIIVLILNLTFIIESFVATSSLSMLGTALFFILMGYYLNTYKSIIYK
jgi:hypothetical protein